VLKKQAVKPSDWNQRPRDVANLANWISAIAERDLNWQVLGPDAASRDFYDAPILYVSGTQPLNLGDETKKKIRDYVEGGGQVLGHADCGGRGFADSFKKLGNELFPKYSFRELPADHVLYTNGVFPRNKWKTKPSVLGLSNGVRELMLLVPNADAGRVWQSKVVGGKEEFWQLGADIFFYAAGRRDLRYRGESDFVVADPKIRPVREVSVARLEYAGNWDPEPGGWRRLASLMHNEHRTNLIVKPVRLGSGQLRRETHVVHFTGTAALELDDSERSELRRFVQSGGTLIVDAAGGSGPFTKAAEGELKSLFPDAPLVALPPLHPLYAKLDVAYRPFAQKAVGDSKHSPRLQAMSVNGRTAVFFSREDLSAGIVGTSADGIVGYDSRSATEIMCRLVLYAAGAASDNANTDAPAREAGAVPEANPN
jgi:hypothetical protein